MDSSGPEATPDGGQRMTTADLARASEPPITERHDDNEQSKPALLPSDEVAGLRSRWNDIQTGFVDEPRRAVEDADALVASAMKRLAEIFASERAQLEGQWDKGDEVSTEDLRIALQRYRSFFGRLLSI